MDTELFTSFLAVLQTGSVTAAAEQLHITQSSLSRQLMRLEDEMGTPLFLRRNRSLVLTEAGKQVRKCAKEISDIIEDTKNELLLPAANIAGIIRLAVAEVPGMRVVYSAMYRLRNKYPDIHFHILSGAAEVSNILLHEHHVDFAIFFEPADLRYYNYIKLPVVENYGLLTPCTSPFAQMDSILPQDIASQPLILTNQSMVNNVIEGWIGCSRSKLNVVARYDLPYTAALMVEEGIGLAISVDPGLNNKVVFKTLNPPIELGLLFAWSKQKQFTKAEELLLDELQATDKPE